jgi:hypothetical protein
MAFSLLNLVVGNPRETATAQAPAAEYLIVQFRADPNSLKLSELISKVVVHDFKRVSERDPQLRAGREKPELFRGGRGAGSDELGGRKVTHAPGE